MLENIEEISGLQNVNLVAAWFLGTAVICLVIGGIGGAIWWAAGKAFGNGDSATKGLRAIGLTLAGALLMGSIGGGIQWSSTSGRTEALLPQGAGQRSISVDRDVPAVACEAVEVEGETRTMNRRPTAEAHDQGVSIVSDLGADAVIEDINRVNAALAPDGQTGMSEYEIVDVRWIPDGIGGDCGEDNRSADPGSEVSILAWGGRDQVSRLSNMFRITYTLDEDGESWERSEVDGSL